MKLIKNLMKIVLALLIAVLMAFGISFFAVYYQTSRDNIDYQQEIEKYAKEYDMDPLFIASVVKVESGYNNEAESHMGAYGLMQLLDETAEHISQLESIKYEKDKLNNPDYNLKLGVAYLNYLYNYFGNWDLVLAAYNGGIGNVDSWINNGTLSQVNPDITKIPITETRKYVSKVNSTYNIYKIFYKDKLPSDDELEDTFKLAEKNYISFIKNIFGDLI
ncbi:MAG: lytic transglycosylase domain-containing protein [Peptoniphilaceae bacterium]|nr:lytic transglycosylase domain-containing protein [Peptoniphilaceae bacterium]MDD7383333.1 lytic transglycosylase domain-containing protein [Peptoniphilaceae bacterium]MDY3738296.1 lytic transglycosylase domain-containing protein [Peptoniphilaceae bacterium]